MNGHTYIHTCMNIYTYEVYTDIYIYIYIHGYCTEPYYRKMKRSAQNFKIIICENYTRIQDVSRIDIKAKRIFRSPSGVEFS